MKKGKKETIIGIKNTWANYNKSQSLFECWPSTVTQLGFTCDDDVDGPVDPAVAGGLRGEDDGIGARQDSLGPVGKKKET